MKYFSKLFFTSLVITVLPFTGCFAAESAPSREGEKILSNGFAPHTYITDQTEEDEAILSAMRPLFLESSANGWLEFIKNELTGRRDPKAALKAQKVRMRAARDYGAREVSLPTCDNLKISSLFFEREDAPLNLLYVVGYFRHETPRKEWAAPFAPLFPDYNVLTFDLRGHGESEGIAREFNKDASRDVQAAVDFLRRQNDKPIVMVGFCLGAALALKATVEAQEQGLETVDALVINCAHSHIDAMKQGAAQAMRKSIAREACRYPAVQDLVWPLCMGDLTTLEPIEMIKKIHKPMLFEYYAYDKMVPWQAGIENFHAAPTDKKMFTFSEVGAHVRIHSKVPHQYRQTFDRFVELSGILD